MKHLSIKVLLLALTLIVTSCNTAKKAIEAEAAKKSEEKPKKGAIKPYDKVITKEAKSDAGLFTVHKIDDKFFYEIPDSLFESEMLMVTRIAKTASGIGFGGGKKRIKKYYFVSYLI